MLFEPKIIKTGYLCNTSPASSRSQKITLYYYFWFRILFELWIMLRARLIHKKLQEISRNYLSGRPPIHIDGIVEEFKMQKGELLPLLKELEEHGIIQFYTSSPDVVKLTQKGLEKVD